MSNGNVQLMDSGLSAAVSAGGENTNGVYFPIKYFLPIYDPRIDTDIHTEDTVTSAIDISASMSASDTNPIENGGHAIFNGQTYTISDYNALIIDGSETVGASTITDSDYSSLTKINLLDGTPCLSAISATDVLESNETLGTWEINGTITELSASTDDDNWLTATDANNRDRFFEIKSFTPITTTASDHLRGFYKCRLKPTDGDFRFNKIALFVTNYDASGNEVTGSPLTLIGVVALENTIEKKSSGYGLSNIEVDVELEFNTSGTVSDFPYKQDEYWRTTPISGSDYAIYTDRFVNIGTSGSGWKTGEARTEITTDNLPNLKLSYDDGSVTADVDLSAGQDNSLVIDDFLKIKKGTTGNHYDNTISVLNFSATNPNDYYGGDLIISANTPTAGIQNRGGNIKLYGGDSTAGFSGGDIYFFAGNTGDVITSAVDVNLYSSNNILISGNDGEIKLSNYDSNDAKYSEIRLNTGSIIISAGNVLRLYGNGTSPSNGIQFHNATQFNENLYIQDNEIRFRTDDDRIYDNDSELRIYTNGSKDIEIKSTNGSDYSKILLNGQYNYCTIDVSANLYIDTVNIDLDSAYGDTTITKSNDDLIITTKQLHIESTNAMHITGDCYIYSGTFRSSTIKQLPTVGSDIFINNDGAGDIEICANNGDVSVTNGNGTFIDLNGNTLDLKAISTVTITGTLINLEENNGSKISIDDEITISANGNIAVYGNINHRLKNLSLEYIDGGNVKSVGTTAYDGITGDSGLTVNFAINWSSSADSKYENSIFYSPDQKGGYFGTIYRYYFYIDNDTNNQSISANGYATLISGIDVSALTYLNSEFRYVNGATNNVFSNGKFVIPFGDDTTDAIRLRSYHTSSVTYVRGYIEFAMGTFH